MDHNYHSQSYQSIQSTQSTGLRKLDLNSKHYLHSNKLCYQVATTWYQTQDSIKQPWLMEGLAKQLSLMKIWIREPCLSDKLWPTSDNLTPKICCLSPWTVHKYLHMPPTILQNKVHLCSNSNPSYHLCCRRTNPKYWIAKFNPTCLHTLIKATLNLISMLVPSRPPLSCQVKEATISRLLQESSHQLLLLSHVKLLVESQIRVAILEISNSTELCTRARS